MFLRTTTAILLLGTTCLSEPGRANDAREVARSRESSTKRVKRDPVLPVITVAHEKIVLPNGLTLIVHEDHRVPVVSVATYYRVGSGNETPGRTGFAHLFEHLMFNGSQHANSDWFKVMNELGATGMNGTTGFDRTNYYQTVPKGALERLLWLESDRMQNLLPTVDQAKLDEQRKVVQNEKRQGENSPLGAVPEKIYGAIYPTGHPYSWLPIGSMQDLNAATLDDVKAFFKKWYGPNNAVLALSGDITVAEARDLVTKYYGDIPSGPALTQSREHVAKMTGSRRDTMQAAIASHQLIKTWNAPGWAASDAQLLRLAAAVLSEGQNSRLHKRLVRDLQLASEVSADMNLQELGSQFSISATARPGVTLSQLEEAINGVLAEFLRSGPTAEELNRLKFARYASYVRGLTSTMAKAQMLAEGEVWARTPDFYRTRQAVTNGATPSSVVDVARKWLADGAYVLEIEALPRRSTTGKSVDRTAQPLIGQMPPFVLPPLQRATLSNGVTVMLAERRDVPTVSVSMLFDVGSNPDRNPASVGLNNLGLTTFGTATRNALEIESLSQDLSTSLSWQSDQELTRFSMNSLKINLDQSLDLYADVLLNPTFPKDEWDRHLKNFEAAFEDNKLTPAGKAWMVRNKMIYGVEHPYGAVYTPAVARTRKVEDFRSFHRKWIRPDLATILVVGDTTLSEIIPMFEQRLKGWKAVGPKPLKAPLPAPGRAAGPRVLLFDQPGAESSLVSLAQAGPARNAEDYDLLSVVDTVVGGGFVSRLNLNLRENKGWSYGARSELAERALIGLVEVGAAVQTDKTAPAMLEIFRELKEVASSRPPSAAEVQSAKNTMLLGMASTLQDPSGAAKLYRQIHQYGLSDDYYNRYTKKIQSFTIEQVQAAARRLYHPSEFTWFVVGDLSKIEKDVRALNLGEVMVYDANGNRVR